LQSAKFDATMFRKYGVFVMHDIIVTIVIVIKINIIIIIIIIIIIVIIVISEDHGIIDDGEMFSFICR